MLRMHADVEKLRFHGNVDAAVAAAAAVIPQ